MILRRFYDENLAQASYLVACEKTKDAVIVDPTVETATYVNAAAAQKLRITHVLETHVHADFLSGAAALAAETGAELCLSAEGVAKWGYDFETVKKATQLHDGDEIAIGTVHIRALHTPGHTPEHLTFLLSDSSRGASPVVALTGDFIFVGDVGRPDLLERAVGAEGTMRDSARALYTSLARFVAAQPDHLQIWPGHGAGSACGKALGAMPSSTLGYEKLFNWALAAKSEEAFADEVLRDQPPPPRYFAEMKKRNRLAQVQPPHAMPAALPADSVPALIVKGATVVDTFEAKTFAAGHIPGTINIPFNKSFLGWAGALIDPQRDLVLLAAGAAAADEIARQLSKIGIDRILGWIDLAEAREVQKKVSNLETITQIGIRELKQAPQKPIIIDVRAPYEWREGHIPGAIHIPLAELPGKVAELAATGVPVAVHCKGGGRSSIAASILRANGVTVSNISEGYDGWAAAGFPVAREESSSK